ncbi:hypothetical protein VCRA2119O147_10134 [Vibrio crassostreae]|nr:hypothetical protein VCRA2117O38_100009 [Vibrio crassostreae]CAK1699317.1 hypothetical protein VCRA2113O351_100074 [Vibrio crassostreae]CAK1707686.1 hypothetical protein VCRA2119O46_100155 [Vibrio crassostreae]CAK1708194.1 hypothetical protein VCRA2116O26_100155 [Vibrio crassostreae]CAK1719145.1 hypothetical protein VCRA2117O378_110097 [Vibrio crassostreae]
MFGTKPTLDLIYFIFSNTYHIPFPSMFAKLMINIRLTSILGKQRCRIRFVWLTLSHL